MQPMIALAAAVWLSASPAEAGNLPPREVPDDPYLPRPAEVAQPVPPLPLLGPPTYGVQVNVDAQGANIAGDAANEPSIAVDPTAPNRIVIGWRQFDTIASNFRQAGWAYSHDGGRTWTFPGVIEPGVFRSDPVLGADAEGTIYYSSLRGDFSVWFFTSLDGGVTWGPATYAWGGDKQWFVIDRTAGPGHGHIYQSWSYSAGCCGDNIYTRSIDGGVTFTEPRPTPGEPRFGQLDVNAEGMLYIAGIYRFFDEFLVIRSYNTMNGQEVPEWDLATFVPMDGAMGFGGGPNPGGLLGQANFVADRSEGPTAGNLYLLCSVDPPGVDPLDVMIARSSDGGWTWEPPVRVNADAPDADSWQWFATMSQAPTGRLDVVWNDTSSSGQVDVSELYYSFSTDGGDSWSPAVALGPAWNSHIGWPNQQKIGDYYDMISDRVGAHLAYAATYNGEQDVYYLRIGAYDCNDNGIPDPDDIASQGSADCNANDVPDECEIAAGTAADDNGNGIPDECECAADLDDSGDVGVNDFLMLLAAWGPNPGHPADLDGDGVVGVTDFLAMLGAWGPCP
jgi:hypothetical protein